MKRFGIALFGVVFAAPVSAAVHRRHFEPDDLDLEQPGILDGDFQVGPLRGDSAGKSRLLLPDFELGLGLTRNVELDVNGAFSVDESRGEPHHVTGDPLWVAAKLGLLDEQDEHGNVWALGLELGPRLPTFDAGGIGYGVLALAGFTHRGVTLVVNAGTLIDPGATRSAEHPTGLVLGLDLNANLDARGVWSLQSELGSAYYLTPGPARIVVHGRRHVRRDAALGRFVDRAGRRVAEHRSRGHPARGLTRARPLVRPAVRRRRPVSGRVSSGRTAALRRRSRR